MEGMIDGIHRGNLKKLADVLDLAVDGKVKEDVIFHMGQYCADYNYYGSDCGTSGCAIGHGPFAGIIKAKDEGFAVYGHRCFIEHYSKEWEWCFSSNWKYIDNSAKGAAKRIYMFLDGKMPDDFIESSINLLLDHDDGYETMYESIPNPWYQLTGETI